MKAFIHRSTAITACVIAVAARPASGQNVNGGFESGLAGWEAIGNVVTRSAPPYGPTEGTGLAVFNSANSTPNGLLRQAVTTVPGQRYRLEFDVGNLSYNSLHQRLQVNVGEVITTTIVPHIFDVIDIPGPGGGATAWVAASYEFTAVGNSVIFVFSDVSQATNSLDLVLDRVRLTSLPAASSFANGGFEDGLAGWTVEGNVSVQSAPTYKPTEGSRLAAFNAGNSSPNGTLARTLALAPGQRYRLDFDVGNLSYNSLHQRLRVQVQYNIFSIAYTLVDETIDITGPGGGATAWLAKALEFTAPHQLVTIRFSDVSAATHSLDLVLDRVRLTQVPAVADLMVNGGFEPGLTGWEATGNVVTRYAPPYGPTEGSSLAVFNSANSTPNGQLRQTVATVAGHLYRLEFDVGNFSYNSLHQRLQVNVGEVVNVTTTSYVFDVIDIPGPGGGATAWVDAAYEFTPTGSSVTIVFTDVSPATNSLDLVLDRVRLIP